MMQLDAARLENVASSVHTLWNGLLDIVVYMAMLVACMGPSMLAGNPPTPHPPTHPPTHPPSIDIVFVLFSHLNSPIYLP